MACYLVKYNVDRIIKDFSELSQVTTKSDNFLYNSQKALKQNVRKYIQMFYVGQKHILEDLLKESCRGYFDNLNHYQWALCL